MVSAAATAKLPVASYPVGDCSDAAIRDEGFTDVCSENSHQDHHVTGKHQQRCERGEWQEQSVLTAMSDSPGGCLINVGAQMVLRSPKKREGYPNPKINED
ncbi:hypothetical protein STEG23_008389 [Scotinomys teguina]